MLGPLHVVRDGSAVRLRPAQRRLLSILLLDPGAVVDREVLVDRMWGEAAPATAPGALQVHLTGLRKAMPGLVATSDSGYRLDLAGYRLDRVAFEGLAARALAEAASGSWERALRSAERALALWRGAPFEELRDDEIAAADIARLTAIHEEVVDVQARSLIAAGRADEAVVELRGLVRLQPLREPLWEHLMVALYRSGRRAEALRAYQEARRVLGADLGVEPGARLRDLEERIARGDEELGDPGHVTAPNNLPHLPTSFVGREDDLREVAGLLSGRRLVTIVGGPGFGKTRLAIEAGHAAVADYPDGAWLVRFAAARSARDVAAAIATAVDARSQTAGLPELARRFSRRRALLVLDNCEHLLEPCRDFVALVLAQPGETRVLATSRRALGLAEEALWRIGPLAPPAATHGGDEVRAALASAAVRLFVDRARATDRTYRLTPESVGPVACLCRRADGIPLALELAAAWAPALGPADIEDMLGGDEPPPRGRRDRPDHHRSLRAAMDWSVALLPPEDRELFHATAIFRGTFGLEDVLGVCTPGAERRRTAAAIGRLVDASLVVADRRADGRVVYRSLVPIREFARESLERSAGLRALRDRFVGHYLDKARGAGPDGFRAVVDLARVDDDLDNLREALALALSDGRADEAARALVALDGYFRNRYLAREERDWLARCLPALRDPATRARALLSAGIAAQATNDLDAALEQLEDALASFRALGDVEGMARALLSLAGLHSNRGEWGAGAAAAREGRELVTARGDPAALGIAATYLGTNLAYGGRAADGIAELREAVRQFERSGEDGRISHALSTLALLGVLGGDEGSARRDADDAVDHARRSASTVRMVRALAAAAAVEARWGTSAVAAGRLLDVDREMGVPQGNEDLFEFLLPAAILVRRHEAWPLLEALLEAVEARVADTGQGYPVPWQAMAAEWRAAAAHAVGRARRPGSRSRPIDTVRDEVVRFLDQLAAHGSSARPGAGASRRAARRPSRFPAPPRCTSSPGRTGRRSGATRERAS